MIDTHFREQLINENREYTDSFSKMMDIVRVPLTSKEYLTVSIIGVQNSGKSTLLNHLFCTQFEVLEKQAGTKTTRGVWLSGDKLMPWFIMDVEGNDSMENAEHNNQNFEKTVAMYALALSNMLIVNVWTKSFGTFEGTQYSVLTKIMDMSVKMFKQESTKTILFCLRDFNDEIDIIQNIQDQLKREISKIWDGIKKPANLSRHSYTQFFNVELHTVRRFRPQNPTNFVDDVAALRKRMTDREDPRYLFRSLNHEYNLPLCDVPTLSKNVWNSIIQEKEFNLPNEKEQVSSFRCQTVRNEVLGEFDLKIKELQGTPTLTNIGAALNQLSSEALTAYEKRTENYDKHVSKKVFDELRLAVDQRIDQLLDDFSKARKEELLANFDRETHRERFNTESSLSGQLEGKFRAALEEFNRTVREYGRSFSQKNEIAKTLELALKNKIASIKERESALLSGDCETMSSRIIMEKVVELAANLSQDFWAKGHQAFEEVRQKVVRFYGDKFKWIFDREPPAKQVEEFQVRLYGDYKQEVRKSLENTLVDKCCKIFSKNFVQDNSGNVRNWLVLTEPEIEQLYYTARDYSLGLIRSINVVPGLQTSSYIDERESDELFDSGRVGRIKDDAEERMTAEYEKIVRSKKEAHLSKVPWYLWVIFVFFMYDDIWFGQDYPFIYYPIMMLLSFVAVFFAIGHTSQLFSLFEYFIERLKDKLPILR